MQHALNAQKHTILYSLCEWGQAAVWEWGNSTAQSWRISDDINGMQTLQSDFHIASGHAYVCANEPSPL